MQTPSMAAITGTSDSSTTCVRRWNSSMVAANDSGVGVGGLEQVVAGREVLARAAHHDAADVGVGAGDLHGVGDRRDRGAAPGVAVALVVPADDAGVAEYLSA